MHGPKLAAVLVLALALAACADRSPIAPSAGPALAVVPAEATPVPLKFHADCGPFTITLPEPDKPWRVHTSFGCVARISHLGLASIHIDQLGDFVAGTLVGDETITAANGDVLNIRHSGPAGGDDQGNVWYGGPIAILGGTGRFAGALGTGTFGGRASIPADKGYFDLEAMIQYAAGQKP